MSAAQGVLALGIEPAIPAKAVGAPFIVGDYVEPKPEWVGSANNVPSGHVRAIAPWGKDGALYVGDEPRAFAAYVFQMAAPDTPAKAVGALL